jgi:hypothetical protein
MNKPTGYLWLADEPNLCDARAVGPNSDATFQSSSAEGSSKR